VQQENILYTMHVTAGELVAIMRRTDLGPLQIWL